MCNNCSVNGEKILPIINGCADVSSCVFNGSTISPSWTFRSCANNIINISTLKFIKTNIFYLLILTETIKITIIY